MSTIINDTSTDVAERSTHLDGEPRRRNEPLFTKLDRVHLSQVNWWAVGWLAVAHVGALFAPWTFTWQALAVTVFLHWVCGCLGITLGYHRMLTHTGFKTFPAIRYLFASIGSMAGEGSPLDWVSLIIESITLTVICRATHIRRMMVLSGATCFGLHLTPMEVIERYLHRWCPDLASDRGMWVVDRMFLPINIALGMVLAAIGYAIGGGAMATSWVIWGVFVRLILVLHSTWLVNSAAHIWGYRNYETTDNSRNNWLVALVSYGEGWHNNHHAYPRMAMHGHKWWELDITWNVIRLMRACGLCWDVVDYRTAAEKRKSAE